MTADLNGHVLKADSPSTLPLDGVVVAELGSGIALALAGRMMAGYGAQVIKIEPPEGDPLRGVGPFPEGTVSAEASRLSCTFMPANRPWCWTSVRHSAAER